MQNKNLKHCPTGYEFFGIMRRHEAELLPNEEYYCVVPAYDQDGKRLDEKKWVAVFKHRQKVTSAFENYLLSIR